ncbi:MULTISPECIES: tripartite tricarboxylate transporter substrate binding protein [unclassified Beijerinckia]|uniref:Bug family tripartite tricarboxylate transporter substrate binding protein n=1 Tax=unclassified Beijerinckia TaxID=2638183 RepID=UPI000895BCE3|nr:MULTISPECIES: tripartite tricarboxylate transporter substrate binding protein [unclassified Beijerinckia]MDH7796883.1 tripartite-type tricarboxylate transporter receptor subunit TctC [Beijerinckia sp. GAS462]SEC63654.1 Tripartite-type tricarboxylate transporter, receptor component TctC [Beijerinckia sp. 28-YEA-48]
MIQGVQKLVWAGLAIGLAAVPTAHAQSWPSHQITFIVPFAPGGGTDAFARPLAAQLDAQLGQRVIIENRAGAGGTVGASAAAKASPDGYTFFIGAAHHAIAPALYPKLDYDIEKDLIPVGLVSQPPQVVVVNPGRVSAKTLQELIDYARTNPDKMNYASAGGGTTHHLAGELFKALTKTRITHVPYRGAGPAMQDLVAGHIELEFDGLGSSAPHIASGALRALAVASAQRSPAFPDVPTAAEAGVPGYEVSTWYGMFAPKGTPPDVLIHMTKELRTAFGNPMIKDAWARNGSDIPNLYGADFGTFVSSEVKRWGKVVQDAGIKLD